MAKGIFIDVKKGFADVIETDKIKDLIDVRVFTIVSRKIGKKYYDIYADDEGLFVEDNPVSIVTKSQGKVVEQIVGSVFIVRHDGKGGVKSLTDNEIIEVKNELQHYIDFDKGMIRPVLFASL
jgi:hypothetical protein